MGRPPPPDRQGKRETHNYRGEGRDPGGATVGGNRWLYRQADEGACHRGRVNRSIHVLICDEIVTNRGRYLHPALTHPSRAENHYSTSEHLQPYWW